MTTEELMIGDYIKHGFGGIGKVTELSKGIVTVYDKGLDDGEGNCEVNFAENEIQPIPLTPEILEKNGFIKASMVSDTPPYDKDEEGNMHFSLNEKFWGWWQPNNTFLIPANGLGWLEFKYAHELQHALRLCNIDKEIIL